jgi:hypothetical protein
MLLGHSRGSNPAARYQHSPSGRNEASYALKIGSIPIRVTIHAALAIVVNAPSLHLGSVRFDS